MPWAAEKNLDTCYNSSNNTRRYQALGAWDLYICNVCSQSVGQRQHTYDRAYVRLITLRSRVPQHWELSIGRLRSTGVAWLVSDVASSYAGVWLGNLFRAHSCAQWLILSIRATPTRRWSRGKQASYTIIAALRNLLEHSPVTVSLDAQLQFRLRRQTVR